jgi:hypothetical protein
VGNTKVLLKHNASAGLVAGLERVRKAGDAVVHMLRIFIAKRVSESSFEVPQSGISFADKYPLGERPPPCMHPPAQTLNHNNGNSSRANREMIKGNSSAGLAFVFV